MLQATSPCKCGWLTTVTCIVAKQGIAFLTLPVLSALGQIVISASCPLNQRHRPAWAGSPDVPCLWLFRLSYTFVSLMHLSLRSLPSCFHLFPYSSSALVSVSACCLSFLPYVPSLYYCLWNLLLVKLSLSFLWLSFSLRCFCPHCLALINPHCLTVAVRQDRAVI